MRRMRARDRALFTLLTPLWLACFIASVLALDRHVVLVPFYVDPAPDPNLKIRASRTQRSMMPPGFTRSSLAPRMKQL